MNTYSPYFNDDGAFDSNISKGVHCYLTVLRYTVLHYTKLCSNLQPVQHNRLQITLLPGTENKYCWFIILRDNNNKKTTLHFILCYSTHMYRVRYLGVLSLAMTSTQGRQALNVIIVTSTVVPQTPKTRAYLCPHITDAFLEKAVHKLRSFRYSVPFFPFRSPVYSTSDSALTLTLTSCTALEPTTVGSWKKGGTAELRRRCARSAKNKNASKTSSPRSSTEPKKKKKCIGLSVFLFFIDVTGSTTVYV